MVRERMSHQQATSSIAASGRAKSRRAHFPCRRGLDGAPFKTVTGGDGKECEPAARASRRRPFPDLDRSGRLGDPADGLAAARQARAARQPDLRRRARRLHREISRSLRPLARPRLERHRLRLARPGRIARRGLRRSTASRCWSTISLHCSTIGAPERRGRMSRSAIRWAAICCCGRWSKGSRRSTRRCWSRR